VNESGKGLLRYGGESERAKEMYKRDTAAFIAYLLVGARTKKKENRENKREREREGAERKVMWEDVINRPLCEERFPMIRHAARHGGRREKDSVWRGDTLLQTPIFSNFKTHRRCRARNADARVHVGVSVSVSAEGAS
jgi:hypothetical protein